MEGSKTQATGYYSPQSISFIPSSLDLLFFLFLLVYLLLLLLTYSSQIGSSSYVFAMV